MSHPAVARDPVDDRLRRFVRDLAIGIGTAAAVLWLTFFGTAGAVEVSTLVAVVGSAIWFASVDPARLVDASGRPSTMVFGLAGVATTLVLTAMVALGSATLFLVMAVAVVGFVTGIVRALAHATRAGR